ncbi:hypothetical protein C1H76_7410 [Elsinoe australis]|uniref:Wax synthase domain-containing protein n=1 Tax=Elsinoe australis TaxID=40998 RepID=A0A4U7ARM2_9PEZI|nr:hypothetical protein C1H76_7410 [Elsinoe australis]
MGAVDVLSVNALLWAVFLLGVKDPRNDFVRLVKRLPGEPRFPGATTNSEHKATDKTSRRQEPPSRQRLEYDEIPYPADLVTRLSWVGTLLISLRFADWKIGSHNHDRKQPAPPTGRTHFNFIAYAVARSLVGFLLVDLTSYVISRDPYFTNTSVPLISLPSSAYMASLPPALGSLYSAPLTTAALRATLTGAQAWALISQQYYLPTVFPVALHYFGLLPDTWSPHLWPRFFGPASIMLTRGLRGFWSTYWHQVMRFVVSGTGPAIVDLCLGGVRAKRSKGAEYTILTICAFGLSGFVHMGLVPREPLHSAVSANAVRLYIGAFFWVQPVGLLAETVIADGINRLVPGCVKDSRTGKALGRLAYMGWIFIWACICFPLLGEAGRQLGWFEHYTVPWSALHYLQGKDAWMWSCLRDEARGL